MAEEKAIVQVNAKKISEMTGYSPENIAIIKNTVAKGTSDTELAYFLTFCNSIDLNPFRREVWCYKDNTGNLVMFAGRDGFLTIGQRDTRWTGMLSAYVCENDEFELDMVAGEVKHKIKAKDRGKLLGAYAIIKPKGLEYPTIAWADFAIYDRSNINAKSWKSNPDAMIQKVAEAHALKKAFGISGLQVAEDYQIIRQDGHDVAEPIGAVEVVDELEEAKKKIIEGMDKYEGDDKEELRQMCVEKVKSGEFDMVFARNTAKQIGVEL